MSSSENNKRIAKNTGMLYIRMMLTMLISLYTSRIVLKVLGVEDYGIYNVVGGVVSMFSFIKNSLSKANSRHLAYELGKKDMNQLKKVYRSALTIQLLIALFILVILETVGLWFVNYKLNIPDERIVAANWIYQFSIIATIFSILQVPYNASIIAHEKMKIYAYLGIFDVVMKLIIVFLITISGIDKLVTYGFLMLIVSVLLFFIYDFYSRKHFEEYSIKPIYEKTLFKELLGYSGWNFIGSFGNILKMQGNNMLLNIFFGPAVNAARGIAYQVNFAVSSFTQNFTTAMNPQIIKYYSSGEIVEMMKMLFRGAKLSFFLLLFLGLPILMETEFILNLWLVDVPEYAVIFTQLVIINSIIESFTFVMATTVQATGKIKWYQIFVGGFLILNLPISYYFLRLGYPPQVTLFISISLAIIAAISRVVLIKKQIPQFKQWLFIKKVYLNAAFVTFLAFIPPFFIKQLLNTDWLRFILISTISVISSIISIWTIGLSKDERLFIKNSFNSLNKKLKK